MIDSTFVAKIGSTLPVCRIIHLVHIVCTFHSMIFRELHTHCRIKQPSIMSLRIHLDRYCSSRTCECPLHGLQNHLLRLRMAIQNCWPLRIDWNLHLTRHWFRFLVDTQRPRPLSTSNQSMSSSSSPFEALTDSNESVGSFLYRVFPGWQTHQHRAGSRIRHPDDEHTAYVVELQCETCSPYWAQSG